MRAVLASAIALLPWACGPLGSGSSPDVRLSVQPTALPAGDSITLVLSNRSSGMLGYNLCTSELERRMGAEEWRAVPSDRVCTMELRTLAAGEDARYRLDLPSGLAPGEYRFLTAVERLEAGERGSVRSDVFRVEG